MSNTATEIENMELEQAKIILLPIHAGFGIFALILGLVALLAPKKKGRHTRLGKAFVILMLISILISDHFTAFT